MQGKEIPHDGSLFDYLSSFVHIPVVANINHDKKSSAKRTTLLFPSSLFSIKFLILLPVAFYEFSVYIKQNIQPITAKHFIRIRLINPAFHIFIALLHMNRTILQIMRVTRDEIHHTFF